MAETSLSTALEFDLNKLSPQQLQIIKSNVAKNATDDELKWFLYQASALKLNPLTKEIWFIKYQGGDCIIMTSRDGFLKKAAENPEFVGIQSMEVRANDEFEMGYENGKMCVYKHRWQAKDRGVVVGAWACVTYKDQSQDWNYVTFSEYATERNPVWKSKPTAMIKKCAESPLLRRAAKMSGVYLPEEVERDQTVQAEVVPSEDRAAALEALKNKIKDAKNIEEFTAACAEVTNVNKGLLKEEIEEIRKVAIEKKQEFKKSLFDPMTEGEKKELEEANRAVNPKKKRQTSITQATDEKN